MSSSPGIRSVASEHTWGTFNTAEETVVANNVRTQRSEAAAKKSPPKVRAGSTTTTSTSVSRDDDSSLFDLDDTRLFDSGSCDQYGSGRSMGQSMSQKMKEAVVSVASADGIIDTSEAACHDAVSVPWMNCLSCLGGGATKDFLSAEEREGRVRDGRNKTPDSGRQGSPRSNQNQISSKNIEEDALLLQKALRDSNSTPRKSRPRKSANVGSLDIVMELQHQERNTPIAGRPRNLTLGQRRISGGSANMTPKSRPKSIAKTPRDTSQGTLPSQTPKRKGKKKSSRSKADSSVDDRTDLGAIRISQSKSSDHSVFDFEKEKADKSKQPVSKKRANWINGPALGTFLNVSNEKNAGHPELAHTYSTFRADKRSIDMVLSRVKCSVPLYHQTNSAKQAQLLMSMSTESEESAKFPTDIKHVCSEPVATTFDVRSKSYLADGQKEASEESIFALLGSDNLLKENVQGYRACDVSKATDSYFNRLKTASKRLGLDTPFLIIINFVVPWGNFLAYFYRPDGQNGRPFNDKRKRIPAERLWDDFLCGNKEFRNSTLKFIPRVIEAPWAIKKMVGTQPAMIGQKIPTSYYGSLDEGYLEICMDVTKGGKMANGICSAVASKASTVSIDLAFLLQGSNDTELPEQILSVVRLHHVKLKKCVVD